jgi:DNA repair exonuclease SbcCD ATPase subunit
MQAATSSPTGTPPEMGKAKPRQRGSSSGQTAKKRELDRIAQKKSRERARNRMAELEEKIRRLQADDKQKQISELMRVIEDLRNENERLRSMTEKIRLLTNAVGPALKGAIMCKFLQV